MGFLPSFGGVHITEWWHHLDADETHGEEARWEQHKNATSCFEQILEKKPAGKHLYGHLPPISLAIQVRRTRHGRNC